MTLTEEDAGEVAALLDAELSAEDARLYRRRYNVAPSDLHWIVLYGADRRVLVPAFWGYVPSGSERPLINVRGEQAGSGRGWKEAFGTRRCAVVSDGFYEWNARREPFWYHRARPSALGGLLLLGGLYQQRRGPGAEAHPRFTVLTTRPSRLVAEVHDRMPVIIDDGHVDDWLTAEPARAAGLIAPAPEGLLVATPVSKRVGSVKNDDPACLAPPEPPRQQSLL